MVMDDDLDLGSVLELSRGMDGPDEDVLDEDGSAGSNGCGWSFAGFPCGFCDWPRWMPATYG